MMIDVLCRRRRPLGGILALAVLLAIASLARGEDKPQKKADPTPPDIVIHLPPNPPTPPPQPPAPGSAVSLPTGKLLLITSQTTELFLRWTARDDSSLSIKSLKGPILVFGDFVDPQPGDEDGRTILDPYIYIVKAKTPGQGNLVVVPSGVKAANSILAQAIDVGGIPPNPVAISITPTSATVPTKGTQQFVAQVSQGGVKWTCSGVGTVTQDGLFTAAASAGTAAIVAASTLSPSSTATANVLVTDLPPPPTDPLTKALQAAYTTETDANKVAHLRNFTAILPVMIPAIKAGGQVTTLAQLQQKMDAMSKNVTDNSFAGVRKVASEYVATKMPKQDAKITDADWTNADTACNDIAKALAQVKGGR